MKNKIGWCNLTFNPTWGCRNKCPYCYARTFAKRCGGIRFIEEWKYRAEHNMDDVRFKLKNSLDLIEFKPTFLYSQFEKKFPKKPQRIFVGSMSEIADWEAEWIIKVLDKIKQYPQHIFQFLTRYPEIYDRYIFPKNCWLGVTITREKDFERGIPYLFVTSCNITFVSVEPILEHINPRPFSNANIDWVIIGFQTNPFKKIEKKAITDIIEFTSKNEIPLFLKDSIYKGYSDLPIIKEFPNE